MRIKDKVAVVLGASSEQGAGWAVAERLAEEGAKVVVGARRTAPLEALAKKIGGAWRGCDIAQEQEVAAIAQHAVERFGKIDIAVNTAGMPLGGSIADADPDNLRTEVEVNFLGNVWFVRHMAAAMNDGGSIVLFSSMATTRPMLPFFGYAATKAAADCMVRYAAMEYGQRGIRVNSILPGLIRTDMARDLFAVPGMEDVFKKEVPLHRIGEASDFADAVLWLAGSAYITGCNLDISGGNQLTRFPRNDEYVAGADPALGHTSERHVGERA
jgi:NAD(P)-dependent dehydrogenase (short-subunit alcohol dehydrogenase family)